MKRKLFILVAALILILGLAAVVTASADTLYETANDSVPIWTEYSSKSTKVTTITTQGFVFSVNDYVTNSSGNKWYKISSGSWNGVSLAGRWVYSGNVTTHAHTYAGNGGVCKNPGCGHTYSYSITSMSALYQGNNTNGAKYWTIPYSTGKAENKGTIAYGAVVTVNGKTTNADGNVWYRLSNGCWVYSENLTSHYHDCTGNGGLCKNPGCGYNYPYTEIGFSGLYQGNVESGAKYWTLPYSTGKSENKGTIPYANVVTVIAKTTNADGNLWYKLSNGCWVYSENLTAHTHNYAGNGGVCKSTGCGYAYPISETAMSALYQGNVESGAKYWTLPYSTGKSENKGTIAYANVVTVAAKATNAEGHLWYKLSNGNWVYSENLTSHYHDCTGNGGLCKNPGCGYNYPYTEIGFSGLYQGNVESGAKYWTLPYSTGKSENKGTIPYANVVTVIAKTTNADGNLWYKLSDGNWVYSENLTAHSHDCIGNGGVCKNPGCGYTYPISETSMSAVYAVTNSAGAPVWTLPYSTGGSEKKRTAAYGEAFTIVAKATNADGHVWFKTSDGFWVWPDNLTRRYTVKYDANGGANPPSEKTKLAGESFKVSGTKPTRPGYLFQYWCSKSDGSGDQYTAGKSTYSKDADATLYAIWTKCTSHDYDGGICTKCLYEYPLMIAAMSDTTYAATNTDGTKIWSRPYSTQSDHVHTADYGTILTVNGETTNQVGNEWYLLKDGTWVYSENVTRAFKIEYVLNGGKNDSSNPSYLYGQNVTIKAPSRTGYDFAGWYVDSEFTKTVAQVLSGSPLTVLKNVESLLSGGKFTLYAKWNAYTYQIAYNGNGSTSGSMGNQGTIYDAVETLTSNAFTKTGYTFRCWNTRSDGSGKDYANEASVKNLTDENGATITLYAQWTPNSFTVTLDPNGGFVNPTSIKAVYDRIYDALPVPTNGDSNFTGWWTTPDEDGTQITASTVCKASGDFTLYAHWTMLPVITSQPVDVTVAEGKKAAFAVVADDAEDYQWYYRKPDESAWKKVSYKGTFATCTLTAAAYHDGYTYRCEVRNNNGTVNSSEAKLTVITKPTITVQPSAVTVAAGKTATFAVTAEGSSLTYKWYYRKSDTAAWRTVNINGNSDTYTLTTEGRHNGYSYRCVVSNEAGSVTSETVKLSVKPAITTQPKAKTVAEGKTATFKVVAAGTGLKYQWYYQKPGTSEWIAVSSNGTSATYTLTAAKRHNGYLYRCKVTNTAGGVNSSAVKLTVIGKPVITTQPKSQSVKAGATAAFKAAASGTGLKYQWYYQKPGTSEWIPVSSKGTSATYTLTTAKRHNGYKYRCKVTNSAGSVYTNTVTLTVK